jgi:hypothetical protein
LIYVDQLMSGTVDGCRATQWCHLIADTDEELHSFAKQIGMKHVWFQDAPPASFPHYDLTARRRTVAVRLGATELARREFSAKMKQIRQTW